jgi:hypothetical protein
MDPQREVSVATKHVSHQNKKPDAEEVEEGFPSVAGRPTPLCKLSKVAFFLSSAKEFVALF